MSETMRRHKGFLAFAVMWISSGAGLGQSTAPTPAGPQSGATAPAAGADGGMRNQSVMTRDPALAATAAGGDAATTGRRQAAGAPGVAGQAAAGQEMSPMGGGGDPMGGPRKADPSTALTLTIGVRSVTLAPEDLERMPQRTVTVHNAHTNADEAYTGVALGDLLAANGAAATDAAGIGRMLRSYVRATGSDGYFVLYSGVEVESGLHAGDVLVATRVGGRPLGDDGRMKLVSSEDKRPARWVRNLMGISVSTVE